MPILSYINNLTASSGEITFTSPAFFAFKLTLTGAADGVENADLPFESINARLRSGKPSYLSAVIPGIDYADTIADRANGDLVWYAGLLRDGVEENMEAVVTVDLEDIVIDEGGTQKSITLTGHKTTTNSSPASVSVSDISYKRTKGADILVRTSTPQMSVNPGDTVTEQYAEDSFTAGLISHVFSSGRLTTEISTSTN